MMNQTRTEIKGKKRLIHSDGIMRNHIEVNKGTFIAHLTPEDIIKQYGAEKFASQQAQVDQTIQETKAADIAQASTKQLDLDLAAASNADAISSSQKVVQLAAAITPDMPSGGATEIASQVVRFTEAAQVAAALPDATDDSKKAAKVAVIVQNQTLADVAKIQLEETKVLQVQAEQKAITLANVAKADDATIDQKIAATQAAQDFKDASDKVIAAESTHSDAQQLARDTVAKAESDAAAIALAMLTPKPEIKPVVAPVKEGLFSKMIDYIYNLIYA